MNIEEFDSIDDMRSFFSSLNPGDSIEVRGKEYVRVQDYESWNLEDRLFSVSDGRIVHFSAVLPIKGMP